jgi:hypothetical protein
VAKYSSGTQRNKKEVTEEGPQLFFTLKKPSTQAKKIKDLVHYSLKELNKTQATHRQTCPLLNP